MLKRSFDVCIALLALVILFPLIAITWVLIRVESRGPGFFCQTRVGRGCVAFKMIKLRSMRVGSDAPDQFRTVPGDSRITAVGRVIRKLSVDELPQLINVLIGDMSLVGPRPDVPAQQSDYSSADWQRRHLVRPGVTGLAQVSGRSIATPEDRLAHDLKYVESQSFLLDLKILMLTVSSMFSRGAF